MRRYFIAALVLVTLGSLYLRPNVQKHKSPTIRRVSYFTGCGTAPSPCVQDVSGTGSSGTSSSISFTIPLSGQGSGHANLVYFSSCTDAACNTGLISGSTGSVSDTNNGVYTAAESSVIVGSQSYLYYFPNIASGATTVTINLTSNGSNAVYYPSGIVWEAEGLTATPLDQHASATGSSATATVTVGSTLAQANEYVVAGGYMFGGGQTVGSGYTLIDAGTTPIPEQKVVASTAAPTATYTGGSGTWNINMATFKCATNCGGVGPTPAYNRRLLLTPVIASLLRTFYASR